MKIVPPTEEIEFMHIIVLASYYRKIIANIDDIMRSLNELTKKDTPFVWSP